MCQALIVEDDPQVAQINAGFLEQSGFTVVDIAADVQQARALLRTKPILLMLLDIYLPGSNGLQMLREIRAENRQVEVIIVSAAKDSTQIREAFRLGCLDYIIKPFTYERLNEALKKYRKKTELLRKDFLDQNEVDLLASQQLSATKPSLPKGIDKNTLSLVCRCILLLNAPFGVQDIVERVQISRVSSKKYLDFLCEQKVLMQAYIYGNKGRPSTLYQLASPQKTNAHSRLCQWAQNE